MFGERKIAKVGDRILFGLMYGTVKEIDEANTRALISWDDGFRDSHVWLDSGLIREVNGESVP